MRLAVFRGRWCGPRCRGRAGGGGPRGGRDEVVSPIRRPGPDRSPDLRGARLICEGPVIREEAAANCTSWAYPTGCSRPSVRPVCAPSGSRPARYRSSFHGPRRTARCSSVASCRQVAEQSWASWAMESSWWAGVESANCCSSLASRVRMPSHWSRRRPFSVIRTEGSWRRLLSNCRWVCWAFAGCGAAPEVVSPDGTGAPFFLAVSLRSRPGPSASAFVSLCHRPQWRFRTFPHDVHGLLPPGRSVHGAPAAVAPHSPVQLRGFFS